MQSNSRFQNGSLTKVKNKTREDSWLFRYYEKVDGKRVHRNIRIGGVSEMPTRKHAENAVLARRSQINSGIHAPQKVEELIVHYKRTELTTERKAHSTVDANTSYLENHILPKWGRMRLSEVRTVAVEEWICSIDRAPGTRTKIRNIMSAVFTHGIRHEWIQANPISKVRCSAKRRRDPDVLTPIEFKTLLSLLEGAARVMVFLAGTTGMRRGEIVALRWKDVDFLNKEVRVIRSCVRNRIGKVKTEGSQKPLPLHDQALRELSAWRAKSSFSKDDDFLFPSIRKDGKQPLTPDMVLVKIVRPALIKAGVSGKVVGWHTFRHSLATNLRSLGIDVKVAQELMRHASSKITMDIYTQAVSSEKREASRKAMDLILGQDGTAVGSCVPLSTVDN